MANCCKTKSAGSCARLHPEALKQTPSMSGCTQYLQPAEERSRRPLIMGGWLPQPCRR